MTVSGTQDLAVNEWLPPSSETTFSDWIADKGKYFCEAASNAAFYVSQIPNLYGYGASPAWERASKGLGECKKFLALPNMIKGGMGLYDQIQKGGELTRNLVGSACYVLSDAIDTVQGYAVLSGSALPGCLKAPLERIKDLTGIFGLGNTAYNLTVDIEKLRQIDVNKSTRSGVKNTSESLEIKKNIIDSEIDAKWYDRLRCLTAIALCCLGSGSALLFKAGLVATATPVPAMVFALLVTGGIYGKYNMYASKVHGDFWKTRYAELVPVPAKAIKKLA